MAEELSGGIARYLDEVIGKKIEKKIPDSSAPRKAIVQKYDSEGTMWAHVIGGPQTTPIVETEGTFKPGDVIDVVISNGKAKGASSSTMPVVTTAYLGTVLSAMGGDKQAQKELAQYDYIVASNVISDAVVSNLGQFSKLTADYAELNTLVARNARIEKAEISELQAADASIKSLIASSAQIESLVSENATILDLIADSATINNLITNNLSMNNLVANKADINFANVISSQTANAIIQNLLTHSGWFTTAQVGQQEVGYLTAVHIDANDVEIEHLKVRDLYLFDDSQGTEGIWYQLNVTAGGITYSDLTPAMQAEVKAGLHGSNIVAGTVTADKIMVQDLSAFNATIAGMVFSSFQLAGQTYYTMHTFGKTAVNSDAPGIYVDQMGQVALGEGSNHIILYKDANNHWQIDISASSISIGSTDLASRLDTMQGQIDNVVETWFGDEPPYPGQSSVPNEPYTDWTTSAERNRHLGDVYYDNNTGIGYRFSPSSVEGQYTWVEIPDSAVVAALQGIEGAVMSVVVEYANGTSTSSHADISDNAWGDSMPTREAGKYVWQRTTTVYGDNTVVKSYACIQGATGAKGDKGDKGDTGEQGAKGDKGDTGEQGIQGIQGAPGEDGVSPTVSKSGDTVTITDGEGNTVTVSDGASPSITTSKTGTTTKIYADGVEIGSVDDGADGSTPVITATKSGSTTTVKVNGSSIATINDGAPGTGATVSKSGDTVTITDGSGNTATVTDGQDGADGKMIYGICTATNAGSSPKVVNCSEVTELYTGLLIAVKFTYANTVATSGLGLNVNSLGSKPIFTHDGTQVGSSYADGNYMFWAAGAVIKFMYDASLGTTGGWRVADPPASYFVSNSTAATTVYKDALVPQAVVQRGTQVTVAFANIHNNTTGATLSITSASSNARRTIYRNGSTISSSLANSWAANSSVSMVFDGKYWQVTDGSNYKMAEDAAKSATKYITDVTNGIFVAPEGKGPSSASPTGWRITDVLEYVKDAVSRFWIGLKNAGDTSPTVRIGAASGESRMELDYHSLQMISKEGAAYLYVSDLRDSNGYATVVERFRGDGSTSTFSVKLTPIRSKDTTSAIVDDLSATVSQASDYAVTLSSPPAEGSLVVITYETSNSDAKAFTFGARRQNADVGPLSSAIGIDVEASGYGSYAEGCGLGYSEAGWDDHGPIASGYGSHAEGVGSTSSGVGSHSEGAVFRGGSGLSSYKKANAASGEGSHVEGRGSSASGDGSHAEGDMTYALGAAAHSEGRYTHADGDSSHAQNIGTKASSDDQTALGRYNVEDTDDTYAVIVGNGTSNYNRSNAYALDWMGNAFLAGHAKDMNGNRLYADAWASDSATASATLKPAYAQAVSGGISLVKRGKVVQMAGDVKFLGNTGRVTIATIPEGYRPAIVAYVHFNDHANEYLIFNTNGDVQINGTMSANVSRWFSGTWVV